MLNKKLYPDIFLHTFTQLSETEDPVGQTSQPVTRSDSLESNQDPLQM